MSNSSKNRPRKPQISTQNDQFSIYTNYTTNPANIKDADVENTENINKNQNDNQQIFTNQSVHIHDQEKSDLFNLDLYFNTYGFHKDDLLIRNKAGHTPLTLALEMELDENCISEILKADKTGELINYDYLQELENGKIMPHSPLEIVVVKKQSAEKTLLLLKNGADFNQLLGKKQKNLYDLLTNKKINHLKAEWESVRKYLRSHGAHNNFDPYYIANPVIESLVFEGGGAKGLVYPGAMKALEERRVINGIKRVGGDSAGAIFSLFVALGYTSDELNKIMQEMNFEEFMHLPKKNIIHSILKRIGDIIPPLKILQHIVPGFLKKSRGTYATDIIKKVLDEKIEAVIGKKNATFRDLQIAKKTNPNIKDLYVQLCNLTTQKGEVFSHENHPDAIISEVVTASAAVPLAFEGFKVKENNQVYTYVDGGTYDNFPAISMFNDERYLPEGYNFDHKGANPGVYLFKVDTSQECEDLLWNKGKGKKDDRYNAIDYVKDAISAYGRKDQFVAEMYPTKIVQINDCDLETLNFELSDEQKQKAQESGYRATKEHLENYRGVGTFYFMYDPKNGDDKDMNLIDRPELKPWAKIEQLHREEQRLLNEITELRLHPERFCDKGRSINAVKREHYRRLKDIKEKIKDLTRDQLELDRMERENKGIQTSINNDNNNSNDAAILSEEISKNNKLAPE